MLFMTFNCFYIIIYYTLYNLIGEFINGRNMQMLYKIK